MRSVNLVILIGHLTRDPELRHTSNGQPVATFSIATNRFWTTSNGEKQEATEYHDLVAWGKLAEICQKYVTKGSAIYVQGRLHTRRWEAPDGTKRHKTEVVIQELNILVRKNGGDGGEGAVEGDMDIDSALETVSTKDEGLSSDVSSDINLDLDSSDLPGENTEL